MTHLVRTYMYVREFPVTREILEQLAGNAEEIARLSSAQNFEVPVEINLNLEEGTLKIVTVVLGTLFSTYYFVGNYKAFKEGVVEICEDANKYGNQFCDKFLISAGISKKQVSEQRVELQTPGKLRKVLNDLEQMDAFGLSLPEQSRWIRLSRAATMLDDVLEDLTHDERAAVTASLQFKSLPPYTQWPREHEKAIEPIRVARVPAVKQLEPKRGASKPKKVSKPRLKVKRKVFVNPVSQPRLPRS